MKMYQAANDEDRLLIIRQDLNAGFVWGETALWIAGVDHPRALMRRADGWAESFTRRVVDAAGVAHQETVWRFRAEHR